MSILGSIGTLLSRMPISEWIALAASAPTIISDAIKLGEDLTPVLKQLAAETTAMQQNAHPLAKPAAKAHQHWTAAWTAVDQRIADQQGGSRG